MEVLLGLGDPLLEQSPPEDGIIFILDPLFVFVLLEEDLLLVVLPLLLVGLVHLLHPLRLDFFCVLLSELLEFDEWLIQWEFDDVPLLPRLLFSVLVVPPASPRSSLPTPRFAARSTSPQMHRQRR